MKKSSLDILTSDLDAWNGDRQPSLFLALVTGFVFWMGLIGLVLWIGIGSVRAEVGPGGQAGDPMVMKIYPDGTKLVLRWSEVGKTIDNGEKFGGAPRIVAYDPVKDGIVPIGEPSQKSDAAATNAVAQVPGSAVLAEQPAKMDYTKTDPDMVNIEGPMEGFGFRTHTGVAFQQVQSYRSAGGRVYNTLTFNPGIRFDLEPFYNIYDWFAVGLETAFIYNTVHSYSQNGDFQYQGHPDFGNGGLYQVPVLANVRFQYPSEGPWKGFVTGGFGGVWDYLTVSTRHGSSGTGQPYSYTSYQWNYALQLGTGFTYNLSEGFDLSGAFKMLCTPNPLQQNGTAQFKAAYSYAAEVGLVWRF